MELPQSLYNTQMQYALLILNIFIISEHALNWNGKNLTTGFHVWKPRLRHGTFFMHPKPKLGHMEILH